MGGQGRAGHTMERTGSRHRGRRNLAAVAAATMAVASFSAIGAVGAPAGAAVLGATTNAGTLSVEAPGVTVLKKGTPRFAKAKSAQKLKTGDSVQTDATGFAEIVFPDGSVTRLDNNTVFTLEKLSTTTGKRQIQGSVTTGQTWNRVQKLSESEGDSFEQKGGGATAAVLGTAFVTKCDLPAGGVAFKVVKTKKALRKLKKATSNCNFTLVDGKLRLTSLDKVVDINRGQQVDVAAGKAGAAEVFPPDILFTDKWILRNLGADDAAGISEAKGQPSTEDLKQARIEGSWPVTLTVTNAGGFRDLGGSRSRTYSFTGTCGTGDACKVTLTQQTANGTKVIPLTFADGVYTGQDPDLAIQNCVLDDGTVSVANGLKNSSTISFSPSSAVADGGLWRATGLSGSVTETATQVAGAANQCKTGTATFALVASR